jgi:FkbM family methyltransferase
MTTERSLRLRRALDYAMRNRRLLFERFAIRVHRQRAPVMKRELRQIGDITFEFDVELGWAVETILRGAYAPELRSLLRRLLRPGDVFIDVGANIGYVSAVALAAIGREGAVHAFEPVGRYYDRLMRLAALNPHHRLVANRLALSDREGEAAIAINIGNIGWSTMVPDLMPPRDIGAVETTHTARLDTYLKAHDLTPALVKIDVEGFELPVLRGLEGHIRAGHHPLIVCEIAPTAYPRIGSTIEELVEWLKDHLYVARDVIGLDPIDIRSVSDTRDVVFVPAGVTDIGDRWVRRRLARRTRRRS